MKFTKKNERAYLKEIMPLIAITEKKISGDPQRICTRVGKDGIEYKYSYRLRLFINHKRHIRTLIKQCTTMAELDMHVKKYVKNHPNTLIPIPA